MSQHAYMILAHNNFYILEKLICLLDDERNDIYIHIDKKVREFDFDYFKRIPIYSRLRFVEPRIKVYWGGNTTVYAEFLLLESALKGNYEYYHLLSGVDLPLKSQDCIHKFFEDNRGKEFVGYSESADVESRVKYYHLLTNTRFYRNKAIMRFDRLNIKLQKKINIDRLRGNNLVIKRGATWFSITNEFAHYILDKKDEIMDFSKYCLLSDEVFLQTYVHNSSYKDNVYSKDDEYLGNMRYIDWERGSPYVFRSADYESLITSDRLFARKFDVNTDKEIIDKIYKYIMNLK